MKSERGKYNLRETGKCASHSRAFRAFRWLFLIFVAFSIACTQKMAEQPSVRPLEASPVFQNGQSARHPVRGTIPSGWTQLNERIPVEVDYDKNARQLPFPLTEEVLLRGQERFNINCAVCHGRTGEGDGMVVRRGLVKPPTYHSDRLRNAPIGHFFDVMTSGFGAMASYANQVEPSDRWAIAAYIRALQVSQNARIEDVPPGELGVPALAGPNDAKRPAEAGTPN